MRTGTSNYREIRFIEELLRKEKAMFCVNIEENEDAHIYTYAHRYGANFMSVGIEDHEADFLNILSYDELIVVVMDSLHDGKRITIGCINP